MRPRRQVCGFRGTPTTSKNLQAPLSLSRISCESLAHPDRSRVTNSLRRSFLEFWLNGRFAHYNRTLEEKSSAWESPAAPFAFAALCNAERNNATCVKSLKWPACSDASWRLSVKLSSFLASGLTT